MIIFNRLEKFASHAGYFSEMQFGFQEGQAVLRHLLRYSKPFKIMCWKGGSKMFSCFLDVRKANLTQFGLMGYCTSYFLIWVSTVNCD